MRSSTSNHIIAQVKTLAATLCKRHPAENSGCTTWRTWFHLPFPTVPQHVLKYAHMDPTSRYSAIAHPHSYRVNRVVEGPVEMAVEEAEKEEPVLPRSAETMSSLGY